MEQCAWWFPGTFLFPEWTWTPGPGILYLLRNCSVPATWEPRGPGASGQRGLQAYSHSVNWTFQKTYRQWALLGAEAQCGDNPVCVWQPSVFPHPGLYLLGLPFLPGCPGKASLTQQSVSDPQTLFQNAAKEKGKVWPGHWPAR